MQDVNRARLRLFCLGLDCVRFRYSMSVVMTERAEIVSKVSGKMRKHSSNVQDGT